MLKLTNDSHTDHAITPSQLAYVLDRFKDRSAFFIETIELPVTLGTVPCGLYGPIMGDPPIEDVDVRNVVRGSRGYTSRMAYLPARPVRTLTVIAGPHGDDQCIVYTMFGGPLAPQEPGDPTCKDPEASAAFWSTHALAR